MANATNPCIFVYILFLSKTTLEKLTLVYKDSDRFRNNLTLIFNHLRLCLANAIHNPKWLKITYICLIWDKTFTNRDV